VSGFLSRWARRKAAATATPPAPAQVAPVDESTLPKLDTLTGDSDITAFLAAGVSRATQSAALRIAWREDARIAGFRGLADYDWDFNAEGYGRLAVADDVAALVRRVIVPAAAPAESPRPAPVAAAARPVAPAAADPPRQAASAEPEAPRPVARRHGGALPA
jgi:hypothetical protein